ncbi:MAG: metal-sensing transcriptional repressor [Candidatus Moraniibacteriota bacterium]|jgi:DNA-binding FrmR family transcriptional regulator
MQKDDGQISIGLKKARTHLAKVILMLEEGEYCVSIMQQNLAVIGLLKSANDKLLKRHLNSCFMSAMQGTNENKKQKMILEILQLSKINK